MDLTQRTPPTTTSSCPMQVSEKDLMIRISSSKISVSDTHGHAGRAGIHAVHNESAAAADVVDGILQEFDGAGGLDHDVEPVRVVLEILDSIKYKDPLKAAIAFD